MKENNWYHVQFSQTNTELKQTITFLCIGELGQIDLRDRNRYESIKKIVRVTAPWKKRKNSRNRSRKTIEKDEVQEKVHRSLITWV